MSESIKIALSQIDIAWENPEANRLKAAHIIEKAKNDGAELVVFPEMSLTGFSMNTKKYGTRDDVDWYKKKAREHNISIIVGLALRAVKGRKADNMALFITKHGRVAGEYRKIHPFSYCGENKVMRSGQELAFFKCKGFLSSMAICYDLRFSCLFEAMAKRKTELVFVIANWPEARIEDWKTLLRARAMDTMSVVVGVNRIGSGGGLTYTGSSSVYGPRGEKIMELAKEEVGVVSISRAMISDARKNFPSLADKRFDLYSKLKKFVNFLQ